MGAAFSIELPCSRFVFQFVEGHPDRIEQRPATVAEYVPWLWVTAYDRRHHSLLANLTIPQSHSFTLDPSTVSPASRKSRVK